MILKVNDVSFQREVLESLTPVLVFFWAEWAAPCRMLAPVFEQTAAYYSNRATFAKLNVDENAAIPGQYGVSSVPTLILFKQGKEVGRKVGALTQPQLTAFLDSHV